jgi:aspartate-semialdehyde dehydrogenase
MSGSDRGLRVGVLGATGAVGREMLRVLEQRAFPVAELVALASERSAGTEVPFRGAAVKVAAVSEAAFRGLDLALFSAGSGPSRTWAPIAAAAGCVVVDNSSAWRADPAVPLVVPEVNEGALAGHRGIVANPNCSTIQMVVALKPLHDAARVTRVIVATYQAVSGKSGRAMSELSDATRARLDGGTPTAVLFPKPMAFNVSFDWPFAENAFTEEEMKMTTETVKILGDPSVKVTATTVRVPVYRGHSEAVYVETERKLSAAAARDLLRKAPGVEVVDDPAGKAWPTPVEADGRDPVYVGRIREDHAHPRALWLWIVSDNLRKGAALNAVQIAEALLKRGLLRPTTTRSA